MTQSIVPQGRQELVAATPWVVVVEAYLAAAVDSPNTRRAYGRHLRDAFALIGRASLADLTGADLAAYRAQATTDGLSPSSQAQALAAVRSFLTWAGSMGAHRLPGEVIRTALRTPTGSVQRPYSALSEPEIGALLAAAPTVRDSALLAVLLGGGLRVSEAVALDVAAVREDGAGGTVLYVRQGKGRKDRTVPVRGEVAAIVRRYLADGGRLLGSAGPLFRSHDRGAARRQRSRLSSRAVGAVVARCAAGAGIQAKKVSPHALRHTYALRCLRHGGNVMAVSKLLGHASIVTTQRYVDHLDLGELRAAVPPLPVL